MFEAQFSHFFDPIAIFLLAFLLMWAVPRRDQGVFGDFIGSLIVCFIAYVVLKAPVLCIWGGWTFRDPIQDPTIHFWAGTFSFTVIGLFWLLAAYCHRNNTSFPRMLGFRKHDGRGN